MSKTDKGGPGGGGLTRVEDGPSNKGTSTPPGGTPLKGEPPVKGGKK